MLSKTTGFQRIAGKISQLRATEGIVGRSMLLVRRQELMVQDQAGAEWEVWLQNFDLSIETGDVVAFLFLNGGPLAVVNLTRQYQKMLLSAGTVIQSEKSWKIRRLAQRSGFTLIGAVIGGFAFICLSSLLLRTQEVDLRQSRGLLLFIFVSSLSLSGLISYLLIRYWTIRRFRSQVRGIDEAIAREVSALWTSASTSTSPG